MLRVSQAEEPVAEEAAAEAEAGEEAPVAEAPVEETPVAEVVAEEAAVEAEAGEVAPVAETAEPATNEGQSTEAPAEGESSAEAKPRRSVKGILAGQGESLSLADFQELRREMWANFPCEIEP